MASALVRRQKVTFLDVCSAIVLPHSCCVGVLIACCGKGYCVVPWSRKQGPKQAP